MSDNRNVDFAARLQVLREAYATRLPGELADMKTLADQALQEAKPAEVLNELRQRLHKLAGSAGSFGFADLGRQARQLEQQLDQWLAKSLFDPGALRLFAVALTSMHGYLNTGTQEWTLPQASPQEQRRHETRIYLLEDDARIAAEIADALRHFGHQVQHFDRLDEAERAIANTPPDFILADMVFLAEGRDSTQMIEALQRGRTAPIPVVFMSSRNDFAAYRAAARAGAIRYFTKPLDVVQLVDFLEEHLDSRRSAPYRVLIVDDDQALSEHYQLVLQNAGMLVETLSQPEVVLPRLEEFHPEVILLDLQIPGCPGPELAKVIRLSDDWLRTPIIYLSAETDIDRRIQAVGQAGDDFLSKPIVDRELVSAVRVRAARSRQLSHVIDRDSLTGLLKHSRIKEQLANEVARAQRQGGHLSLAMIDLDHFKRVNDTWGHPMGDRVIKALAHLLRQRLRKTDVLGRYGGEEFIAILPGCGPQEAWQLLETVRKNFDALIFQAGDSSFQVTLSVGIACLQQARPSAESLLQEADDALYQAKRNGRDQVMLGSNCR